MALGERALVARRCAQVALDAGKGHAKHAHNFGTGVSLIHRGFTRALSTLWNRLSSSYSIAWLKALSHLGKCWHIPAENVTVM